jgi:2-C-methyl-D-erythritol 4-phosphate cytidylyltransferase
MNFPVPSPSASTGGRGSSAVLIVAGGVGARMGAGVPKQFLLLAGKPVLMHTITQFYRFDATLPVVVVLPAAHIGQWEQCCRTHHFTLPHTIVSGGATRLRSVKNALAAAPEVDWVAVHDGVRPLTPVALIARCFDVAAQHGSAVPVVPLTDSLRKRVGEGSCRVPRDGMYAVQTPQVFRSEWLKTAYGLIPEAPDALNGFTDDASVVEAAGFPITLTEGCRENIKITEPLDRTLAEALRAVLA